MSSETTAFDPTIWEPITPEKELYGIYKDTVEERFPAFGVRDFRDVAADFLEPFLTHDPNEHIEDDLLYLLVTPESFQQYCSDLEEHIVKRKLDSYRNIGSVVFATDHGQFTDVPITAEALARIGFIERPRLVQVISTMISTMTIDLGKGSFAVTGKLRGISNLLQTVPRLDGKPSVGLLEYRERRNTQSTESMEEIIPTSGSVVVMSAIGRHNQADGKALYVHEPNNSTFSLVEGEESIFIPLYIHCPTFGDKGSITPANIQYEIFEEFRITDPKESARHVTELFRAATERTVGHNYPNGVHIRSWTAQQRARGMRMVRAAVGGTTDKPEVVDY